MKFVIVTGMSGSGKTVALKIMEDIGYECVDNMPIELLQKYIELTESSERAVKDVALVVDIRRGKRLEEMPHIIKELNRKGIDLKILFLDAKDEILIQRYKESRRLHPLAKHESIEEGIVKEREILGYLRERADYILDTGDMLTKELRCRLVQIFVQGREHNRMYVRILSFGYTYGIPRESDLVFDVRFLPNPFYEKEMRVKSGLEKDVKEYVFSDGNAGIFIDKLEEMIRFLLPLYTSEGKNQLVIAIGCTGGQHRSVAIAEEIGRRLEKIGEIGIRVEHKDCNRNIKRIAT